VPTYKQQVLSRRCSSSYGRVASWFNSCSLPLFDGCYVMALWDGTSRKIIYILLLLGGRILEGRMSRCPRKRVETCSR
jgi:hypothetical protein